MPLPRFIVCRTQGKYFVLDTQPARPHWGTLTIEAVISRSDGREREVADTYCDWLNRLEWVWANPDDPAAIAWLTAHATAPCH